MQGSFEIEKITRKGKDRGAETRAPHVVEAHKEKMKRVRKTCRMERRVARMRGTAARRGEGAGK